MARNKKIPVIHVVHKGAEEAFFDRSRHNGEIIADLRPVREEVVLEKSFPNSFAGPNWMRRSKVFPVKTT